MTTEGLGPVLVGMSRERAEEEAGTAFISEGEALQGCKYVRPANLDGVSFMVIDDEIARIDVRGQEIATQSGIRVGDAEDAVYEAYGDQLQREEHPYLPEGGFLKFTPEDSSDPTRMIFVTNGSQVEEIYAGREPEVDAPEGCV